MKKFVLIFTMLIFWSFTMKAQDKEKSFRFGLHGSPTVAWLKPQTEGYKNEGKIFGGIFGFSYGLMSEFPFSKNYSFLTGLDVSYQGGELGFADTIDYPSSVPPVNMLGRTERTYKIQYVEVPILLKMKTNEIGYMTYFAKFGIAPDFKWTAKSNYEKYDAASVLAKDDKKVDIKKDISFFRISMILGLGFEYSLGGSTCLLVGATFNNGFTDVLTSENYLGEKEKAISNYVSIDIGILF